MSMTVVTELTVMVPRRKEIRREPLRLSSLLRYALATALPRDDGQPSLLPTSIPTKCCCNLFQCRSTVKWRVGDGRNRVFFCQEDFDRFWEAGHEVKDFEVERWVS
jgi:hypothetical protein